MFMEIFMFIKFNWEEYLEDFNIWLNIDECEEKIYELIVSIFFHFIEALNLSLFDIIHYNF